MNGGIPLQKSVVFGLDVYPQYNKSENFFNSRLYALTIMEENAVIKSFSRIPKSRLLRLLHIYRPIILAVDNIYELDSNINGVRHFFSTLPSETRIIQVTGSPKEAITLQEAAHKYGIKPPLKTSPLEESEACARLATLGVGSEVQVLENETKILICRDVSLGPGGSSQSRYRRNIHTVILTVAKKIGESLRKAGIDYDLFTEESDFGLERANFIVYAPRTRLLGIIRSSRGNFIRVKINPIYRNQIEFATRETIDSPTAKTTLTRKLILGVDPGTTCGLAVLSFGSEPVYIGSHRGLSRGDIARILLPLGDVIIVAADVVPAPEFAEKLAKSLNSVVFTPASLLEAAEKQDIANNYISKSGIEVGDSHARDALVAAIKAYQHYKNKFEQIEAEVLKTGLNLPIDEVKALVVRGYSIQRAINLVTPKQSEIAKFEAIENEDNIVPVEDQLKIRHLQERISIYKPQVKRLKDLAERAKHTIKLLESEVNDLKISLEVAVSDQAKRIREERESQILQREIEVLRKQIGEVREESQLYQKRLENMRYYKELESKGEVILLKPVEEFTIEAIDKAFQMHNIKTGDVMIFINASSGSTAVSDEVSRRGIRAVIVCTSMVYQTEDRLKSLGIPLIPSHTIHVEWIEDYPYVKTGDLEKAIKDSSQLDKAEMGKTLQEIIDEYKTERIKALKTPP
ncbi:MAG: hypothetical protein QG670_1073 [Thermoproteota archaeon]|nr:hypothetical protein [Thermoproteota archaeon]